MSAESTRNIFQVLKEVRDDLDEPQDDDTNFWSQDFLLARLNRGLRQVWQTARETSENWFIRQLASNEEPITIFGRPFDPSVMRLTEGITEVVMPPDLFELRYLEPVRETDTSDDAGLVFRYADMSRESFRMLSRSTGPTVAGGYTYDVIFREAGPRLRIAPACGLSEDLDIRIEYVRAVKHFGFRDGFETSGFNDIMIDAAIAYCELEAYRKEGNQTNIAIAEGRWTEKQGLVRRSSGPRQTVESETVDGFLENEID